MTGWTPDDPGTTPTDSPDTPAAFGTVDGIVFTDEAEPAELRYVPPPPDPSVWAAVDPTLNPPPTRPVRRAAPWSPPTSEPAPTRRGPNPVVRALRRVVPLLVVAGAFVTIGFVLWQVSKLLGTP